jgi:hypothetical protein
MNRALLREPRTHKTEFKSGSLKFEVFDYSCTIMLYKQQLTNITSLCFIN